MIVCEVHVLFVANRHCMDHLAIAFNPIKVQNGGKKQWSEMETNDESRPRIHHQTQREIIMEYHRIVGTITVHFIRPIRDLVLCERLRFRSTPFCLSTEQICVLCVCAWNCDFIQLFCVTFFFVWSIIEFFGELFICAKLMHNLFHWEKKSISTQTPSEKDQNGQSRWWNDRCFWAF